MRIIFLIGVVIIAGIFTLLFLNYKDVTTPGEPMTELPKAEETPISPPVWYCEEPCKG